jgi:hypothetical protein
MATHTISPAGDPFSARRAPSTRHHRVDEAFLELLEEDFGIPEFALSNAFMGFPREPKKSAIRLCEWASRAGPMRGFAAPRTSPRHGPTRFYPSFTEVLRPFNTESRGRVYPGEVDLGVLRPLPSSSRSP